MPMHSGVQVGVAGGPHSAVICASCCSVQVMPGVARAPQVPRRDVKSPSVICVPKSGDAPQVSSWRCMSARHAWSAQTLACASACS